MLFSRLRSVVGLGLLSVALVFGLLFSIPSTAAPNASDNAKTIREVMEIQDRNTGWLFEFEGVCGTGTGLTADGNPCVVVFADRRLAGIPLRLEGAPVVVRVTGGFHALKGKPAGSGGGGGGGSGKEKVDPTSRFPRPTPIGVSVGNERQCSAGTVGCRLTDGTFFYGLSNNHVFALENSAEMFDDILQPGLFDTNCAIDEADVIAVLAAYVPMDFSDSPNFVDAAIAMTHTTYLGNATPSNGYGTPKSETASAFVGQKVQKYGRTSSLTKGNVTVINVTVAVGYSSGTAMFFDQIIVQSRKPFIKPGDSGSLLVTDPDRYPVGLLFAGTADGKLAVANRIDRVLSELSLKLNLSDGTMLTIDGE